MTLHLRRTHLGRGLSFCGAIGETCTDLPSRVSCPLCLAIVAMAAQPAPPMRVYVPVQPRARQHRAVS